MFFLSVSSSLQTLATNLCGCNWLSHDVNLVVHLSCHVYMFSGENSLRVLCFAVVLDACGSSTSVIHVSSPQSRPAKASSRIVAFIFSAEACVE